MLIERLYCLLDWENGVAVVAGPLHTFVIYVAGVFHCAELFIHICGDMLHYSVDGQPSDICDGVVAGMALVRAAVLTVKRIGVDRDWSVNKIQIKDVIRQSE